MDFERMFKKLGELTPASWIAIGAMVALGVLLLAVSGKKNKWSPAMLAFAALSIALSFLLSNIRLYRMPQGGSVTPASMLPLMLFAYAFGLAPGLLAGLAYGALQLIQMPTILTPFQVILDYPLAFAVLGFAGLLRGWVQKGGNEYAALSIGVTLAQLLRFACSTLSGVLFFAEYAEGSGYGPLLYSIVYNGSYMLPETLICLAVALLVGKRLAAMMRKFAGLPAPARPALADAPKPED